MKKLVSLTLALVSAMLCLGSCTPTTETELPTELISASTRVVYNNLCYYVGNIQQGELSSENTIKIQNLSNLQQDGIQLYSDPIGNDDPFRGKYTLGGHTKMLVAENATKANGGMPVLLIGLKRETIKNGENVTQKYEIMSYNTATNKVTVIAEDIDELQNFYL